MNIVPIDLSLLRAHPLNSNVMPAELFEKLVGHLRDGGRYPPLIVRPAPDQAGAFQILDGHHRLAALRRLGHAQACCVVWNVDDAQASILLATLNRLQGRDDPHKRAALVADIQTRLACVAADLSRMLPENSRTIRKLQAALHRPPEPAPPRPLGDAGCVVHFFLTGREKSELESALAAAGGTPEQALMTLIRRGRPCHA